MMVSVIRPVLSPYVFVQHRYIVIFALRGILTSLRRPTSDIFTHSWDLRLFLANSARNQYLDGHHGFSKANVYYVTNVISIYN